MSLKRFTLVAASLLVMLLISSCGSSTSTGTSTSSSSGSSTGSSGYGANSGGSTPTAASTSAAIIKTSTASVGGTSETILTNAQGMSLYYYTPDTTTTAACTGACTTNWPPLLFTGTGAPTAAATLPGQLAVATNANGQQVTYNGHFLYTFAGDSAAGQVNGQGKGGKWYVATPDLQTMTSTGTGAGATTGAVIKTAMATVDGKSETILTNAQGMTLYYFTPDTETKVACTGGCATAWPPLLFTGSGSPTAATTLSGELAAYQNTNGNQVAYNGHLLYTYSGDTAAGQVNGQGVGGKWFVATPDLAKSGS